MAKPYLAPSLVKLRDEINTTWPKRDKRSDGWIGDSAHSTRKSEHNPDAKGCVHAIDVDVDGVDVKVILREVIGDPRVWYVIHDRTIWSRTYGWKARRYTGPNPHTSHFHVSIRLTEDAEKDTSAWLKAPTKPKPKPVPKPEQHKLGSRVLKRGSVGSDVATLQRFLGLTDDGIFGVKTERAVLNYQKMRGLKVDGIAGPKTLGPIVRALD